MLQLKKSVSLESLTGSLRQRIELAARLGAVAVEIDCRRDFPVSEATRTAIRQVRKWLDDFNLSVALVSYPTRSGLDDPNGIDRRMDGIRSAMRVANELGCRVVSSQGQCLPDAEDGLRRETLIGVLRDLSGHSLRAGAWLALRTAASPGNDIAQLLESLPAGAIGIDFDPAGLLLYGHDPVQSLDCLGGSVMHFRARDAVRDRTLPAGGAEVQLGRGSVDMAALLARLEERDYNGYVTVQRQAGEADSVGDCVLAMEYLDNLFR